MVSDAFYWTQVNASGQFCGVAEMTGRVDNEKSMEFWQQDKWTGYFPVKWHIIKDVPNPTILDIKSNPNNISFVEIEAALVPRSLPDVDAAVTNTDWILQAGLDPKSALVQEDKESPYVNVIVVRDGDENKEDIQKFVKLYNSPEIRTFIETTYKGAVIPGW